MKLINTLTLSTIIPAFALALVACNDRKTVGESIDDALEQRPAEDLQDAAEELSEGVEDAAEEVSE